MKNLNLLWRAKSVLLFSPFFPGLVHRVFWEVLSPMDRAFIGKPIPSSAYSLAIFDFRFSEFRGFLAVFQQFRDN